MFDKVAGIEGDIVECGVGHAHTFHILALLLQEEGTERKLWGFDSFEGFPEPSIEDASPRNPQKGEWQCMNAQDVVKFLFMLGFREKWIDSHIKIVKGFFRDTLASNTIGRIAMLHLDVDIYGSYKTCLQYLFPKVV
ncbi:MAG: TylF/MycF/NovP-related O-methyltransferase, partial [Candidatus Sungbacteria bacterium]|nr:TylF/MycF/NovP-related O-methyltransferase [Candidatus Sungbacteria bacterium]